MNAIIKKTTVITEAFLVIIVLQAIREGIEYLMLKIIPDSTFSNRMLTMSVMILLSAAVYAYSVVMKMPLSFFPKRFDKKYIIFTVIAVILMLSSPSNYSGGIKPFLLLFYSSIVTPVFEELIFRGYLWNRINSVVSRDFYTYLWSVVLFTVWHIGYMIPSIAEGNINAVFWKMAAGVGYGIVLGFVRLKAKNCYASTLVHGVLNVFMI